MGLGDLIAVYGAISATVALLLQLRQHLNSRGLLRIDANINRIRDTENDPWDTNIVLVVTNVGQVPVLVRQVGLEISDYASYLRIDEILEPSQFFRCGLSLDDQGQPPLLKRKVWVEDGRRKKWRVRNWRLLWRRRKESTISLDYPEEEEYPSPPNIWVDKAGIGKGFEG